MFFLNNKNKKIVYYIGVSGRGSIGSPMPAPHVFFINKKNLYYVGVPGRGPIGSPMPAPHVFF
jgi:hypothetical protein